MDWYQLATLISVVIAGLGVIIWMVNKIDVDVKSCIVRLDGHAARIDQLYQTFMQYQKATDQKFYDLLKEGRK